MRPKNDAVVVGFDLNSTRVRAVAGSAGSVPRPVPLDGDYAELPMFLSLEHRHPEVGRAGLALCRRLPHLTCGDFLAHLGTPRTWQSARYSLDAAQALALVLKHLSQTVTPEVLAVAVPPYLSRVQKNQLIQLAEQARWPVAGTLSAPLAAALAAHAQQPWDGSLITLDVDDHALTISLIVLGDNRLHAVDREHCAHLSFRVWKERLLNAVAERCIRRSRRDPRDSSAADQALYEQLDAVLQATSRGRLAELTLQGGQWFHDLVLRPEQVIGYCAPLVAQTIEALHQLLDREARPATGAVVVTAEAAQLPGLTAALEKFAAEPQKQAPVPEPTDDFGENLLQVPREDMTLTVLAEDACARVAFALAAAVQRGQFPRGHFDSAAPLLPVPRSDPGSGRRFGVIG